MTLPLGFGDIDFSDWARGLASAFISGGAAAVTSGITVNMLDPSHYNPHTSSFYALVGAMFVMNGVMNMMNFLRTKPIPELKTVEKTVQQIDKQPGQPTVVTTVKETSIESTKGETSKA